mmetsp:Transcript_75559/g.133767  ORF Transcript_75559/g.133767 Transcript_75559/m.133767 type:complete len:103 (+) Transcript_75559:417-725(+)
MADGGIAIEGAIAMGIITLVADAAVGPVCCGTMTIVNGCAGIINGCACITCVPCGASVIVCGENAAGCAGNIVTVCGDIVLDVAAISVVLRIRACCGYDWLG